MIMMGKNKYIVLCLGLMVIVSAFSLQARADEREKGYFTVYEENTLKKIFATSRIIHTGDKYLNHENNLYEVTEVFDDDAIARFVEKVDLSKIFDSSKTALATEAVTQSSDTTGPNPSQKERLVAIYCTHSDESYIPTDGASSIPNNGGVYKVGSSLKGALEKKGIKVIQSFTSHNPHDAMAYERSRRTAMELLKQKPDAVIDVHRDAVPAENYQTTVHGQPMAQVQLVVGRENPQMQANDNFAKQMKARADEKYPGLVKGIFYGKGGYNQELYPRNILIEAGTYLNPREKAQDGADIMADVIATTLYGADYEKTAPGTGGGTTKVPKEGGGTGRAILWILGISVLGLGGYALVSTGGIKELSAKTKQFMGSEFTNFLGKVNKHTPKPQPEEDNQNGEKKE